MEELGFQSSSRDLRSALEPHFDDERTLLTARRVVPLERIKARVQRRRRWFLTAAFAFAMLLGAGAALVASYLSVPNVPVPDLASEEMQTEALPAPVVVAETATTDLPAIESEKDAGEDPVQPAVTAKVSAVRRRTVSRERTPEVDEPRDARELSEDEALDQIRDAVLFDEWQERRARRATRRERRRIERRNHRDLSNLDEIFEGRRRPQN